MKQNTAFYETTACETTVAVTHARNKSGDSANADTNSIAELQNLLADDLTAVNAEILNRMQSPVALIPQLAAHLIAAGGKRLRPLLTLASAKMCGYAGTAHIALAASVEFIHTATLLHDDVVDESKLRRGQDTANSVWGNKSSVLVGDFLFSRSFQLMVDTKSMDVLRILANASSTIAQGEVHQLITANNMDTKESEYRSVIAAKTASLFAAACESGAVIAKAPAHQQKALADYGLHLGMAFQISDDALDYHGLPGKEAGDDFRDGKVTLPVILAYTRGNPDEQNFWKKCFEEQNISDGDFKEAVNLLRQHNAIKDAMRAAATEANLAIAALTAFTPCRLTELLAGIARYAAHR